MGGGGAQAHAHVYVLLILLTTTIEVIHSKTTSINWQSVLKICIVLCSGTFLASYVEVLKRSADHNPFKW